MSLLSKVSISELGFILFPVSWALGILFLAAGVGGGSRRRLGRESDQSTPVSVEVKNVIPLPHVLNSTQ
jgi:hypothetical protein